MHTQPDIATASLAAELEATWDRLALATPQPDPFCGTTHWQLAFREAIDPDRPMTLRHSEQGLIQFAEHEMSGRTMLVPLERNWLFGCNLLGPDAIELLAELLAGRKKRDAHARSCPVVVAGLEPHGALLSALHARLAARFVIRPFHQDLQCGASLAGGLDGFLARRSANQRRNLRRAAARAAREGVSFERHSPVDDAGADAVFARMLAVELTSWKGLDHRGMESPRMTCFYSTMLRRLARPGDGRVMFAVHEGRDIGFIFGGLAGGIYRGQQFSFDADYGALSVGNLLQLEQVRWLCEEGAWRYDLGPAIGPSMAYKRHWTELQFPIEAWIIRRR